MSPVVHGLIAWLLAAFFLKDVNDRRLVIIAGVALDIDGIFVLTGVGDFMKYHHTFGHSYIFGFPLAITAAILAKNKNLVFPVALGTFSLHLIADIIGTNWAVYPLYPFSMFGMSIEQYLSNFMIYYIINLIAFVLVLSMVIIVIYRKEFSPIEFISEKLDNQIIGYYINSLKYKCELCGNRAFIKCPECGNRICSDHSESIIKRKCIECSKK